MILVSFTANVCGSHDVQKGINNVKFTKLLLHIADNLLDDDVKRLKIALRGKLMYTFSLKQMSAKEHLRALDTCVTW